MSARAAAAAAERRRAAGGGPPAAADSSSEVDVDGDDDGDGDGGGADDDDDDDTYDPRGRSRRSKRRRSRGGAAGALPGGERAEAASAAPGYSWEEEYKRSWDVLQEDETGSLGSVVQNLLQQQKRKRLLRDTSTIHRGIIRHLFLIIDLSTAMLEKDLRPSRLELTFQYAYEFVQEYFDQNPISQLGIITTRDGVAEKLTELSGNPMDHIRTLQNRANQEAVGEPSLQNALELARSSLTHIPAHGSREILVILASLTTCDPGDLSGTIMQVKKDNIRASVIALAAEVQICKVLCKETKGTYAVPLNEPHFKEILFELIPPPAVTAASDATNLVVMGFPKRITDDAATLCACHQKLTQGGYRCPRCASKICELPTKCDVCSLTLVSSPHLARSYHHLFPVENYSEVPWAEATTTHCSSCLVRFENSPPVSDPQPPPPAGRRGAGGAAAGALVSPALSTGRFRCPNCRQQFCFDCDIFIHEVLHNCPGCLSGLKAPP